VPHPNDDDQFHGDNGVLVCEPPFAPRDSNVLNEGSNLSKKMAKYNVC
jgi:hypothetical protein